ncbi:MAG: LamG domain-containing protein, partial [Kiritimatiellia bacterium]|nr:LamG domain-containing protein [Kiritimatiellia bacterium]
MKHLMFLVLAVAAQTAVAATPEPLFHLSFDGHPRAEKSAGNPEPLVARDIEFGPGLVGEAVQIGEKSVLEYSALSNLRQDRGTVTLWYCPDWDASEQPGTSSDRSHWKALFCNPRPTPRTGSGALWFWFWGGSLRGDMSDSMDNYTHGPAPVRKGVWHHLAFVWGSDGHTMFMDGKEIGGKSDSYNPLRIVKPMQPDAGNFASFFIGNHGGAEQARGRFDEVRIYAEPLSEEQVRSDMARFHPVRMDLSARYIREGENTQVECQLTNLDSVPVSREWTWRMTGPGGWSRDGKIQLDLPPGASQTMSLDIPATAPGRIHVELRNEQDVSVGSLQAEIWALAENALLAAPDVAMRSTLLEEINPVTVFSSESRFSHIG